MVQQQFIIKQGVVVLLSLIISFSWIQWGVVVQGQLSTGSMDWGHITVRSHAHMFWWLYYTVANVSNYTERPLIMWLQGGPGMASSGYGNFLEIGPVNTSFHCRDPSFVSDFNVLFVDNPVGVGYSYYSNKSAHLVENGEEIGRDLVNFYAGFLQEKRAFANVPLYVFGESYGGKMAVEFAHRLLKLQAVGGIGGNLKGVALGDAYVSPIDYVQNYAPLAFHLGLVDKRSFTQIDELAKQIQLLISKEEYKEAANIGDVITDRFETEMQIVDIYNILEKTNSSRIEFLEMFPELSALMDGKIKAMLNLSEDVSHEFFNIEIYKALKKDFMRPVTDKIEDLLRNENIKIIVYNGVLDFLVNTAGTVSWLDKLIWIGGKEWRNQSRVPFEIDTIYEGYFKKVRNLSLYIILRAGHSVPIDNMPAMMEILRREIGLYQRTSTNDEY